MYIEFVENAQMKSLPFTSKEINSGKTCMFLQDTFFQRAKYFLFIKRKVISKVYNVVFGFFWRGLPALPLKIKWSLPNKAMQQKQNVYDVLHFLN